MTFTAADKLACAERELRMRRKAYPRFIENSQLSAGKAERELALMEAIVADYCTAAAKERLL